MHEQSDSQQTNEEGPDTSKGRLIDDSLARPLESRGGKFFRGVAEFIGGKPGKFCLSVTGVYIGLEKIPGLGNQIHNWLMERNLIDLGPETLSWAGPATSAAVCVAGAYVAWKAVSWMTSLALGKNKP